MKIDDIKRIVDYTKARLEDLAQPNVWVACTKDMESGELKAFKQSCIDDEIIIKALEKQIPTMVVKKNPICYSKSKDGEELYKYEYYCPQCDKRVYPEEHHCPCGQALAWSEAEQVLGKEDEGK